MFGRTDPFFVAGDLRPRNTYLESLHRTYGNPRDGLPKRKDEAFARAMKFRESEKQHYKSVREENDRLQNEMSEMCEEMRRIQELREKLSKASVHVEPGSVANVRKRVDSANSGDRGSGGSAVEQKAQGAVQRSVLPAGDRAGASGPVAPDGAEGPVDGSGPGQSADTEHNGAVREDRERPTSASAE